MYGVNKMKKLGLLAVFGMMLAQIAFGQGLADLRDSSAFRQYQTRPKTELSKLIYLLDRFNAPGIEIKIDGNIYTTDKAFPYSKGYLAKNYKKEKAEDWIRAHCYRSMEGNKIIYMRVDGSDFRPVRDMLIEELKRLPTGKK